MSKRERPGYTEITIEVPIEVAEWLAVSGEHLGQIAALAANKARFRSETAKEDRAKKRADRQAEFHNLGRTGYRQIASELVVDARTLELSQL